MLICGLDYGLDDRGSIPGRDHSFHSGSGAHPASYQMGTRGYYPRGKMAGAWSQSLTSI